MATQQPRKFLDEIITARKRRLAEVKAQVPLEEVRKTAEQRVERRDFAGALAKGGLRVIAEMKQASPSRGLIRRQYDCAELAAGYESAGAVALSVLTEEQFFLGSLEHLNEARRVARLPVLRKDFILDSYQVFESVAAGADALLLIVAALSNDELQELIGLSERLHIAPLVEVHTEEELRRALAAGARIVGVNNRDLKTFQVSLQTSFKLRREIPSDCLAISESGIKTGEDLRHLEEAGFQAALIGEHLLVADNPGKELATLLEAARALASRS